MGRCCAESRVELSWDEKSRAEVEWGRNEDRAGLGEIVVERRDVVGLELGDPSRLDRCSGIAHSRYSRGSNTCSS